MKPTLTITDTHIANDLDHDGHILFEPPGDAGIITVGGSIRARGYIRVKPGWSLKCGEWLTCGESLKCGGSLECGEWLTCGGSLECVGSLLSRIFEVRCQSMRTRTLPFWREYYAAMPPLAKWAEAIRDESKCWNDLRDAVTPEEAEQICEWDGWHWIIRAQLRMFLGLSEVEVPPEPWRVEAVTAKGTT